MKLSRRALFRSTAAALAVLPAFLRPQPCDGDWMEAEWLAGRPVVGRKLRLARAVKMPVGAKLSRCIVTLAPAGFIRLHGGGHQEISFCVFAEATAGEHPGPILALGQA